MRDKNPLPVPCSDVQATLVDRWMETPGPLSGALRDPAGEAPGDLHSHLETCADCRHAAYELGQLDRCLQSGFLRLDREVGLPSPERIDETIRRVSEAELSARLRRRLVRPVRLVLWAAFFAFTFLLCCLLAVALYKALAAL